MKSLKTMNMKTLIITFKERRLVLREGGEVIKDHSDEPKSETTKDASNIPPTGFDKVNTPTGFDKIVEQDEPMGKSYKVCR